MGPASTTLTAQTRLQRLSLAWTTLLFHSTPPSTMHTETLCMPHSTPSMHLQFTHLQSITISNFPSYLLEASLEVQNKQLNTHMYIKVISPTSTTSFQWQMHSSACGITSSIILYFSPPAM